VFPFFKTVLSLSFSFSYKKKRKKEKVPKRKKEKKNFNMGFGYGREVLPLCGGFAFFSLCFGFLCGIMTKKLKRGE